MLTIKQEAFVMAYAECGNASEAYRQSYDAGRMKPSTVNRKAAELLDNGKITARLDALQAEARQRHDITIDTLTEDAYRAIELAKEAGQAGAYVSALTLIAKMHGLLTERREVTGPSLPTRIEIDWGEDIEECADAEQG